MAAKVHIFRDAQGLFNEKTDKIRDNMLISA